MTELELLRNETNKTYQLTPTKRRLVCSLGAVHYKDNYADAGESWKDIDLTLIDDRITKAPYTLVIDKKSIKKYYITVTDKRTGDTVEIKLKQKADASTVTDSDFLITPENTAVKVKLPHGSTVTVTKSKAKLTNTKILHLADNDDKFTDIADKEELSYDVEVQSDISVRTGASADDALCYDAALPFDASSTISVNNANFCVGQDGGGNFYTSAGRYTGITIPNGSTVDPSYLKVTSRLDRSATTVNSRIQGEQSKAASQFSTVADYAGRTRTTAYVNWSGIGTWVTDTVYTSPDIKTIVQELVDDYSGLTDDEIVIFWSDTGSTAINTLRSGYSWDASAAKAPLLEIDYTALIEIEAIASEVSAIVISVPEIVQSISIEAQSCEVASIVVGAAEPRNIILAVASEFDITSSTPDIALSIWIEAVTCGISSIDTAATDITLSIAIENQPMVVVVGLALPVPSFILEMVAAELSVALSIPVILIPLAKNIIDDYNSTKVNNMQPNIIGDNKPVNIDSVTAQTIHSYYPRSVREN